MAQGLPQATAAEPGSHVVLRDMGCTLQEFARWLPGATDHAPVVGVAQEAGIVYTLQVDAGTVRIEVQPQPPRRIASIVLPVLRVRFEFIGLPAAQRDAFLERFDAYTRRGGG